MKFQYFLNICSQIMLLKWNMGVFHKKNLKGKYYGIFSFTLKINVIYNGNIFKKFEVTYLDDGYILAPIKY